MRELVIVNRDDITAAATVGCNTRHEYGHAFIYFVS